MTSDAPRMPAPRVPPPEEFRFKVVAHTRWSDEDNHGVLNNAVYLTLFEEARHAYFSALGAMDGRRFPFVLAHCNVVFVAPGRGGVDVEIDARTTGSGRTSLTQAYRVRECATGDVWCEAEARLVFVDAEGKKRALPADLRSAIVELEDA